MLISSCSHVHMSPFTTLRSRSTVLPLSRLISQELSHPQLLNLSADNYLVIYNNPYQCTSNVLHAISEPTDYPCYTGPLLLRGALLICSPAQSTLPNVRECTRGDDPWDPSCNGCIGGHSGKCFFLYDNSILTWCLSSILLYMNGIWGFSTLLISLPIPTLMYTMVTCKPSTIYLRIITSASIEWCKIFICACEWTY